MWLSGLILLLLIMGFGFSGYLLPWDQTAYFATKIGTEVPRSLPYMGDFVSYFMKGGEDVSSATLTRMFALHVGVLPVLSLVLVFVHTTLSLLFGSSVPPNARVTGSTKFFPDYMLKEAMVWLVGFAILITVAILYPWELGAAYDLMNPTEPPAGVHPEWYFMFLFQTLKIIPEWLAIVLLNVVLVFWMFVPYLDRRAQHQKKSPVFRWIGIAAIGYILVTTTLAYFSVAEEKAEARREQAKTEGTTEAPAEPAPAPEGGTDAK
jgi:cytochrome b6